MITYLYYLLYQLPYFRGRDRLGSVLELFLSDRIVRIQEGVQMHLDLSEATQRYIWLKKTLEPATSSLARDLLKDGDVAIDVGAHVGYFSLLFRHCVGERGRVVSIEPQPYNADRFLRNLVLNNYLNVFLFLSLAGENSQRRTLRHQTIKNTSDLSLVNDYASYAGILYSSSMVRLDSIIDTLSLPRIALLKIDAESYEHKVLEGLGNKISLVDNIILEVLGDPGTYETNLALSILKREGYDFFEVDGSNWDSYKAPIERNIWAKLK